MAEEKVTATKEVADAELSEAWDAGVKGEVKEAVKEEVKTETKTETEDKPPVEKPASAETEVPEEEEVIDHKESSKLGRKFKGLESRFDQILARLDKLHQPETKTEPIEAPEVIATPEDVRKVIQADKEQERRAQEEYEQSYIQQTRKLAEVNSDLHEEIMAEMLQNFNVKHSVNASADARINYAEAKASVLQKKIGGSRPKVPEREKAETAPVQPAASATRAAAKTFTLPKLDPQAQSYVDYLRRDGMSDEDIAKELL